MGPNRGINLVEMRLARGSPKTWRAIVAAIHPGMKQCRRVLPHSDVREFVREIYFRRHNTTIPKGGREVSFICR
jgi:hypothetical protein